MTAAYADDLMGFDEVLERFDPVMGMEVHVEPSTNTKMFPPSSVNLGAEPNSNVDPCSLGFPGALSVANRRGVEWAIKIGLVLNCEVAESSRFACKNYLYPDQPKNYQTSQYDEPIAYNGYLSVQLDDGMESRVEIECAHMEEDTSKLTHLGGADGRIHGATRSLVDYNRVGTPLIGIVIKPILGAGERAPEVVRAYVSVLRDLVRPPGVSDARMNQDSMHVDSNVSLRPIGQEEFGTRTEAKNINSLRSVEQAVRYETQCQATAITNGEEIIQKTRHYQETDGTTSKGCPKGSQLDYRHSNDPDLPPVIAPREWMEEICATLPELPWVHHVRIQEEWGLKDEEMRDLVNAGVFDLVVDTAEAGADPAEACSWWVVYLAQRASEAGVELAEPAITPVQVARVIALTEEGRLTNKLARKAVDDVFAGEDDVDKVAAARGLEVVRGDGAIEKAVDDVLAANPDIVEKYRAGNKKVVGTIVGQVMKVTYGKAGPTQVNQLIAKKLSQQHRVSLPGS